MGCKASAVRGGASDSPGGATPSPSTSHLRTPHDPRRGRSGDLQGHQDEPSTAPRESEPSCPRRGTLPISVDRNATVHLYAQDDDPFAPPPPLPPELDDDAEDDDNDDEVATHSGLPVHPSESAFPRLTSDPDSDPEATVRRRGQRPENHFDPVPLPSVLQLQDSSPIGTRSSGGMPLNCCPPSRPSSMIVTLDGEDQHATFRTEIEAHDKTDSTQAALEYQQRVQAKRSAMEAYTKQRKLDECDPVRPVDSFNVTHRCLLGRCWDRRAPELIPVSFVHAMESALRTADESHPGSTTTSHPAGGFSGRDEYSPGTPHVTTSWLSQASGSPSAAAASSAASPGRRVPRRSHWFSLGGVTSDSVAKHLGGIPGTGAVSPQYVSSNVSTPVVVWPGGSGGSGAAPTGSGVFPVASAPANSAAAPPPHGGSGGDFKAHSANGNGGASGKPSSDSQEDGMLCGPLTLEQIAALSWEKREQYFNDFLCRNPRYMGIRDTFAFRLADGVSDEPSTKFLRRRNLDPAPGVVAMRWNRVELFHPTLHTLIRAVAMTQGLSLGSSQPEAPTPPPPTGMPRSRWASSNHVAQNSSSGVDCNDFTNAAAEGPTPRRSLSQFVMGHVENRSFTLSVGDQSPNASFAANTDRGRGGNGTVENSTSHSNTSIFSPQLGNTGAVATTATAAAAATAVTAAAGEAGYVAAAKFPEDSVLSLALCIPSARLPQLASGSALHAPHAGAWRPRSGTASAASPTNSRVNEHSTLHSPNRGGASPPRISTGPSAGAGNSTVLVALTVSSFSVSIDPFRWQEHRYTRFPVDMDGSKRSARQAYGEGIVTDIMYGGVMVVECSSTAAAKELQTLLVCMSWTEGSTLSAVVGEVRKHFKQMQIKARPPGPISTAAPAAAGGGGEPKHRYRVWRRIGGRPMRDAVELQEISYFLSGDEPREATAPLLSLNSNTNNNASVPVSSAAAAAVAADPEATPSYSRVASAWVSMPVIGAVLRTWGLHLLSYPEYAQPTAIFLQRYCGIAPVLMPTALSSFYQVGNTPTEESEDEVDYLFFEGDGADTASQRPALGKDGPGRNASRHLLDSLPMQGRGRGGAPRIAVTLSDRASEGIVPRSYSRETMEGDGTHLADSVYSGHTARELSPGADRRRRRGGGGGGGDRDSGAWSASPGASTVASLIDGHDTASTTAGDSSRRNRRRRSTQVPQHASGRTQRRGGNGVPGCSGGKRHSGSSRLHPNAARSGPTCETPLSPNCGTRPQSRRHDRDADLPSTSSSSSTSSFPLLTTAKQHSTTVFHPTSYSRTATQPITPGVPTVDSQRSTLLNRTRPQLSDGDTNPSGHSAPSLELPPPADDDGPTPAVRRNSTVTFCPPKSPGVHRQGSGGADASLSRNETRGAAAPTAPSLASTATATTRAAAPAAPLPAAPPKRKKVKAKAKKAVPTPTATSSVTVAPSPPSVPPPPPAARAAGTPSHTSQSSSPLSPASLPAAAAAATGKHKKSAPAAVQKSQRSPKYPPLSLLNAASPFAQLRSRSPSALGCNGGGAVVSPCSPGILMNSSILSNTSLAREEEQEGLWYMAMLEVRAQQQELEELRQARHDAEDQQQRKDNELRSLNRILLPHTTSQELDGVLLYLKTALHATEDLPHGRLFLSHPDWMPMLAAVWTSPANRIRTVEVATELTWVDIPRLGLVTGLLHHQHAAPPLEELVLRTDKLLGTKKPDARHGLAGAGGGSFHDDDDATLAERSRRSPLGRHRPLKLKRGKGRGGRDERSSDSLHFTTELDQVVNAFGAGCPPFIITPEEARDTLWLLLCAVAANAATPVFRVVLRGLPTGEASPTGGGGGAGRVRDYGKYRTPSTRLAAFFATAAARFRDEHADAPLLLKPRSMLLENFVVRQGTPVNAERDGNSSMVMTRHSSSHVDDGGFYNATGSIRPDEDSVGGSFFASPKRHGTLTRQISSFAVGSSLPMLMDHAGLGIGPLSISPLRSTCAAGYSNGVLVAVRSASGVASPRSGGRAVATVAMHQHPVQRRRPWMVDGNDLVERPFYELLVHRCRCIKEAIAAATEAHNEQEDGQPLQCSAPYVPHHHHPFNTIHNDPRFFVDSERQERLQEAARRAAASAASAAAAICASGSSSYASPDGEQRHDSPPQQQQPVPSLYFRVSDYVFGLQATRDEQVALESEAAVLRERAGEIWEALRKSVKHYNQMQVEQRQRAQKRAAGSASPSPLPPPRQIVLEF